MANEEKLYCTVCLKYHMVLRVQKSAPVFVHVYSVYNGKVPRKDLDFPTAQSISKEGSNFHDTCFISFHFPRKFFLFGSSCPLL